MADSTFTPEQLATLESAIAQGALEVWYGDKRVKYRTLTEMNTIRDMMRKALGLSQNKSRAFYPSHSKGLD